MTDDHKTSSVALTDPTPYGKQSMARVHPLVAQAMTRDLDPDTLRKLLDLQRDWEAGEAKRAYSSALVALKRDLPTVINRDKTVDYSTQKGRVRYTHASLGLVLDVITGPLAAHGFSLSWEPRTDGGLVYVTCRLTHAEGHSESTTLSAPVDRSGSKSDAQGVASTITLLERYSACALLGIATADMQDPIGGDDPDRVDTSVNLKAVRQLSDLGFSKDKCEQLIGKPVSQWSAEDLDTLRSKREELIASIKKQKKENLQ